MLQKSSLILALLAVVLVSVACSSMLLGGGHASNAGLGTDKRTAQQQSEDNAISSSIRNRFSLDSAINASTISVSTYLRTVTLSGTTASFETRDRAVSIARATDNVRGVNNQIQVNSNR